MRETVKRRVVVTGLGPLTPVGHGSRGLYEGLRRERSAIDRITRFDPEPFSCKIAGEVRDFDPAAYLDAKRLRRLDRYSQFAVACGQMAIADARLDLAEENRDAIGCFVGSALGGAAFAEEQHTVFMTQGIHRVRPTLALSVFCGAASCNIAIDFDLRGPSSANSDSCSSGAIAIGEAFRTVRDGYADVMLAGGVEVPLTPLIFGAFAIIRAMSTRNDEPARACRPFDRGRDGFVMAEGAALLVLEELEHARRRGAPIYGEVLGYGTSNDAHHMTAPLPTGVQAARAMRGALAEAGIPPEAIGYINAHASGTPLNDATETLAIKQVLGDHAYRVPVSGTKAMHGHALGASGAIEAAICMLALRHAYLPPTVNLDDPDPACDLDYIPGRGREAAVEYILSNSFGFGGINASLVFGQAPA
ncbi:MAG: beta-ketoacyl-ACP synthase II [Bacillati bacterium ANGP1]|uniref:3-oxoacyl-[acyl-carrier-protein] synthase 2 n=1 Tax=Candidatus Segetimicrobium genomatis TaxID=2569760 RepID=A0A537JB16_9BACT|nr:MAG: beta-ketoacyl-ACP synthase II [Terrabacteria group bacterium ANGP1]